MKSVGITALGMLLLAGCAQQPVQKECEAPKDTIIRVQDGGYPVVSQDPIYVCKSNVKPTWVIDPSQTSLYEFKDDSIVVHDIDDEFASCKSKSPGELDGKDKIKCSDLNKKHGQGPAKRPYKYDIRIYPAGSAADAAPAATYDPSIAND